MRIRLVYLLPNLVTTASFFCGFYAILAGNDHRFHLAVVLIFIAMLFDALDGRIARLTHTQSTFGMQYDSLSDLVSFGIAPAMVMYQWSLYQIEKIPLLPSRLGWMAAFVYASCVALRLARFNAQAEQADKAFFTGLPSTAAAGVIAGFVGIGSNYDWSPKRVAFIGSILLIVCGLAMISSIRYFSGKAFKLERKIPFPAAILPTIVFALVFLEPVLMLFFTFTIYAVHGPVWFLWRFHQRKQRNRH